MDTTPENEQLNSNDNDYIIRMKDVDFQPTGGIGQEIFRVMKFNENNIAQYIAETEEEETYGSLLKRIIRAALKMKSEGINSDDIIGLCTNNHNNSVIPFFAAMLLGAKVASLDPSISVTDTVHLLQQVQPTMIFTIPQALEMIEKSVEQTEIKSKIVVFGENDLYSQFSDYLNPDENEDDFLPAQVDPQETAIIFFSSGTTGLPKGICQSNYALLVQAVNMINNGVIYKTTLFYTTLYWISSVVFVLGLILNGTPRVVCSKFDPKEIWFLIHKYKISLIFLSPTQASEMCFAGRPDGINTSSLLSIITGGTIFSEKHLMTLRDLLPGTSISQAYGQTELAGPITSFNFNQVKDNLLLHYRPNSCGRPMEGISYKVVDPESREILGPNKKGELLVKSRAVMNGYYNLDSSDCFEDGWLKTGDIVYYDDDLCFYIVDRVKELLKYKSWHIPPALIENILNNHPAIKKAIVIGVPHEEDGDHPMAIVILKDPEDTITSEEIEQYVAERVQDRQRLRAGVKFVRSFPITPSGKIKRQVVKQMVLAGEI